MNSGHEPLRDRLRRYILETDNVTFAELTNRFGREFAAGKDGDSMEMQAVENVVLWSGLTERAAAAMSELLDSGDIRMVPTSILTYLVDEQVLTLPLLKRPPPKAGLKTRRWLPVVLRPPEKKGTGERPRKAARRSA